MSAPRGLSDAEAAAWEQVASTVTPLHAVKRTKPTPNADAPLTRSSLATRPPKAPLSARPAASAKPKPPVMRYPEAPIRSKMSKGTTQATRRLAPGSLDSHWDKKLKAGRVAPDFTLDLHGVNLEGAHDRLMRGLAQARAMQARVVLLVAGKSRPAPAADRAEKRGAIRAKLLDWLAVSEHGDAIAAIRKAHRHHGGDGALYLVLRRGV